MEEMLPQLLDNKVSIKDTFPLLVDRELEYISEAKGLFDDGYYSYCYFTITANDQNKRLFLWRLFFVVCSSFFQDGNHYPKSIWVSVC